MAVQAIECFGPDGIEFADWERSLEEMRAEGALPAWADELTFRTYAGSVRYCPELRTDLDHAVANGSVDFHRGRLVVTSSAHPVSDYL